MARSSPVNTPLVSGVPSQEGLPPSPPISPNTEERKETSNCTPKTSNCDPPLLNSTANCNSSSPSSPASNATPQPFYPQTNLKEFVEAHRIRNSNKFSNLVVSQPTNEEYMLAISCVSTVARGYNANPKAWREREVGFFKRYPPLNRKAATEKQNNAKLRKLAPAPVLTSAAGVSKKQKSTRVSRPPKKRSPQPRSTPISNANSPLKLTPRPPRLPTTRDDIDYHSLPDFSPPLSTLPKGNNKILKAEWKGQMLDLSNDPDRHLLHEAEVVLAATLRLSCATYLCSKRRIFQARIEALRPPTKDFRKTYAQQACKIDVNKASKLWSAYDKVDWFNPAYFSQFI